MSVTWCELLCLLKSPAQTSISQALVSLVILFLAFDFVIMLSLSSCSCNATIQADHQQMCCWRIKFIIRIQPLVSLVNLFLAFRSRSHFHLPAVPQPSKQTVSKCVVEKLDSSSLSEPSNSDESDSGNEFPNVQSLTDKQLAALLGSKVWYNF